MTGRVLNLIGYRASVPLDRNRISWNQTLASPPDIVRGALVAVLPFRVQQAVLSSFASSRGTFVQLLKQGNWIDVPGFQGHRFSASTYPKCSHIEA